MNSEHAGDKTAPMSRTSRELVGRVQGVATELALAVYHRHGVAAVPLQPSKSIVVGRSAPADVVVADASLSRTHARFTLAKGSLVVEDLGSTNGTRVRGELVERAVLSAGEPVVLGGVVVAAHLRSALGAEVPGIEGHDRFVAALELQLAQAQHFGEPLAVVMARPTVAAARHVSGWCPVLRSLLRPVDVVGIYSDDTVEVLFPRTDEAAAAKLMARLRRSRHLEPMSLAVGVAGIAERGAKAERLLERSRKALLEAGGEEPVRRAGDDSYTLLSPATMGRTTEVVESPVMVELFEMVDQLARSELSVLLVGETGTGKEVVARAIHQRSRRGSRSLVCVNCGAIPEQLVESTLFGHERGAFTGAERPSEGVFGAADGGTLLLDEVGELPAAGQAALLRALETGHISRVGSAREIAVDVRVLAATHRDLEALAAQGGFRHDLLYRLNAATLIVPPLRERLEEIPTLVERFIENAMHSVGRGLRGVREPALEVLQRYHWPGNVRELRNVIERAVVIAHGEWIEIDDLPKRLLEQAPPRAQPGAYPEDESGGDLRSKLRRYETDLVIRALRETEGNRARAAELLGIPLRSLTHRMKLLDIKRGDYRAAGQ